LYAPGAGINPGLDGVWTERTADDRMAFDDFQLSSQTSIWGISWQGTRSTSVRPVNIHLSFIPDNGSQSPVWTAGPDFRPRALWSATYPIDQVNERLEHSQACASSPQQTCGYYAYSVTMTTPFTAEAGTRYWLLIQAESPPTYTTTGWQWRKGTPDNNFSRTSLAGTTFPWDFAFALLR
jgi:hypothetical protein